MACENSNPRQVEERCVSLHAQSCDLSSAGTWPLQQRRAILGVAQMEALDTWQTWQATTALRRQAHSQRRAGRHRGLNIPAGKSSPRSPAAYGKIGSEPVHCSLNTFTKNHCDLNREQVILPWSPHHTGWFGAEQCGAAVRGSVWGSEPNLRHH